MVSAPAAPEEEDMSVQSDRVPVLDRVDGVNQTIAPTADPPADFSLVLGGPLYQLWRQAHLTGDGLQLLRRRIVVITGLAWVPLLLLSVAEGHAWGGVALPFFYDVELHARLLLALPLLIVAELVVHRRLRSTVLQFLERRLIPDSALASFDAAIASALRLRNSVWAEAALIAVVYIVGVGLLWRTQIALVAASWHGAPVNGIWHPTLAGWWLGLVTLPLFQFLLLRWYFRLFIWARFLWQVSRLELQLMPLHPDRCGGLGFLAAVSRTFSPVLLAQGVLLAGLMANRIFYAGATLPQFKVELIGLVAVMVFAVLGPLLVFAPHLEAAKRAGMREYGGLAQRYVREYDRKWLRGGAPPDEPLVGSADIQSLADLGNSYEVVKEMRWFPFTLATVLQLAVTTLVPVVPLMLTMLSPEQFLDRLLQLVF
jgi:hypothetical protein